MGISTFALDDQGKPLKGDALLDFVYELGGDTIFLQFSTGKDSICSWLRQCPSVWPFHRLVSSRS